MRLPRVAMLFPPVSLATPFGAADGDPAASHGNPSVGHLTSAAPCMEAVGREGVPASGAASTVAADGEASTASEVAAGEIGLPPRRRRSRPANELSPFDPMIIGSP